ncbi:hypothetical protein WJX73_004145 [Symbiochloris irregularis]|uniref:ABC1 atypical kinase-like domain-containing protein n=1 Tax=Symbiochloris irregularis TaxID=706552 RepID=A0AAW1P2D6_9CHLO
MLLARSQPAQGKSFSPSPAATATASRQLLQLGEAPAAETLKSMQRQPSLVAQGIAMPDATPNNLRVDESFRWARDDYSKTRRSVDIWAFALTLRARTFLLDQAWSYPGGKTDERLRKRRRKLAAWARDSMLALGPTFIKLGQLFSTRSDLFPAEVVEELSQLQDRVPAFPGAKAEAIVTRELGMPPSRAFRSFSRDPFAAASLGQVHRAVTHGGDEVVVKVQRPGLKALFDIDLANLRQLAKVIDKGDEARDLTGIVDEASAILYQEIDYISEGKNADRFRRNFVKEPWIRVPLVHWASTTSCIITLEYMPGTKITDLAALEASGVSGAQVARRATDSYLMQVLQHGFLHSDPHPGNIAVDSVGNLIFYDFGMMSEIRLNTKERLSDLAYGVYRKDAAAVISALQDLGILVATGDTMSLQRAIGWFLNNISKQAERKETLAAIGEDLFSVAVDQPFRFPAAFTFVLRAFTTLEGLGKALDPDFQFVTVAQPYAQQILDSRAAAVQASAVEWVRDRAVSTGTAAVAMPERIAHIDAAMGGLQDGTFQPRVRVMQSERFSRRAGILQVATINSVISIGMLQFGTQLALGGQSVPSGLAFTVSTVFGLLVGRAFWRVRKLDKFEKDLKGGAASGL